jgi:phosphoglycolate phosphatase-like HAD superfamily hydrolase
VLRQLRLLILDLDHLIFDCSNVKAKALRESLISFADEIPHDVRLPDAGDVEEGYQETGRNWVEVLQIGLDEDHLANLQSACRIHEQRLVTAGVGAIFPGLIEFLASCRANGATLAIGAEADRDYLLAVSDTYGLDGIFEIAFCAEDFGKGGTDEMLEEILERAEVNPSEALALGTRQDYFRAAQGLDILTLGCGWGVSKHESLRHADLRALSLPQAYSAVEKADTLALRRLG